MNSSFSSSGQGEERSLLAEIQEVLPQSYLVFLLADLRLMSGTGRIGTKYETIALDSDICSKNSAALLAGVETADERGYDETIREGLSPAQIMAVLLLELKKTSDEVRTTRNWKNDSPEEDQLLHYRNDPKKRRNFEDSMESLLRAYSRMIASDLKVKVPYVQRRRSVLGDVPDDDSPFVKPFQLASIEERSSEDSTDNKEDDGCEDGSSVLSDDKDNDDDDGDNHYHNHHNNNSNNNNSSNNNSSSNNNNHIEKKDSYSEDTSLDATDLGRKEGEEEEKTEVVDPSEHIYPLHRKQQQGGEKDVEEAVVVEEKDQGSQGLEVKIPSEVEVPKKPFSDRRVRVQKLAQQIKEKRKTMVAEFRTRRHDLKDEVTRLLPPNQDALTQQEFQELTDILFEMGGSNADVQSSVGNRSPKELMMLMKRAVASRQYGNLRFMSKLFKEGSISQLMVKSSSRIVWMNDWYPLKDLTYAIAVDKDLKRVLVVFRGAITKADWHAVKKFAFQTVPNPVSEDFPEKSKYIDLYTGFYEYLFRKRKDTNTTKYDEIANIADRYGRQRIGPDYNIVVTGHSLGAALTTLFSLYASTEDRFTRNGPVKAFTFGGPYIGGHSFADTFRHQERRGKLQCVRVHNDNDLVAHLPFNFKVDRRGCYWRHIGIGVKLPMVPSGSCFLKYVCFWKRRWKPRVWYQGKEKNWLSSTANGFGNNVFLHFPWRQPWNFSKMHTLFELQDRLMYGTRMEHRGGEADLLLKPVDELYAILHEQDFTTLKR